MVFLARPAASSDVMMYEELAGRCSRAGCSPADDFGRMFRPPRRSHMVNIKLFGAWALASGFILGGAVIHEIHSHRTTCAIHQRAVHFAGYREVNVMELDGNLLRGTRRVSIFRACFLLRCQVNRDVDFVTRIKSRERRVGGHTFRSPPAIRAGRLRDR